MVLCEFITSIVKNSIVGVLSRQTYQGVPEIVDCAVEDRQTWNSKVKAGHGTQIYTGSGRQSSEPYVLFGVSCMAPCAWVLRCCLWCWLI